jgi:hypothetical protein
VGDDPHISIVTFTTDVEDGVDYQGGGPSARRWERERQLLLGLRTPGPSSRRATETPPQSGYPWIVGSVVAVLVAVSHQVRGTESRSAWVRAGTLRKSSVRRLALTLGTPSVFGRAETNSGGPGGRAGWSGSLPPELREPAVFRHLPHSGREILAVQQAPRTFGSRHPVSKVPGIGSVTPFVVSVMATLVYVTSAISRLWPGGHVNPPGPGGVSVSDAVT